VKTVHLRTVLIILSLGVSGCQQHEKPAPPKVDTAQSHAVEKETTIIVPDSVKGKWKAVRLAVVNKSSASIKIYTIPIGGKITLPGAEMTIAVDSFLPAFIMEGSILTSSGNELKNPGAKVRITEGGTVIFKGWLFSRYPTTHAFMHPKYGFTLTDAVPANNHR
jgi:hypothetical protein